MGNRTCHRPHWLAAIAYLSLILLSAGPTAALADDVQTVTVFAAASTTNVMTEIGGLFGNQGLGRVVCSFAASSTLAKQIVNGAPADIFISADRKWMDFLLEKGLVEDGTRRVLLGNRLVLISPLETPAAVIPLVPGCDLLPVLGDGRLAMGDPDHVPAGSYGKAALLNLAMWPALENKIARLQTVRAALAMVERGEAPLGVVYATDAAISKKVKIVAQFPPESHPEITYPVAVVKGRKIMAAERFMEFLNAPEAMAVFQRAGFTVPR